MPRRKKREEISVSPESQLHDRRAEEMVLGCFMVDETLLDSSNLEGEDFFDEKHRLIFAAMKNLRKRGIGLDPALVTKELGEKASECGGEAYLFGLMSNVPSVIYYKHFAEALKALKVRRKAFEAIQKLLSLICNPSVPFPKVIEAAQSLPHVIEWESRPPGRSDCASPSPTRTSRFTTWSSPSARWRTWTWRRLLRTRRYG